MKKISIILLFLSGTLLAQQKEFKKSLTGIKKVQITTGTRVNIITGTSNTIVIKNNINKSKDDDCGNCGDHHYDNDHEHDEKHNKEYRKKLNDKTKGLTAIYPGGKDNTNGYGFSVLKEGSTLIVKDLKSFYQRRAIIVELPRDVNLALDTGTLGSAKIQGFTSEVEVNSNVGSINMTDVTGPITAHSSTGSINVQFVKVNQSSPITVSSATGEIDVTMPAATKANLELNTNGTVYSNFDIQPTTKKGLKNVSGLKKITTTLNDGGVKIKLKSAMGNIYLRKK